MMENSLRKRPTPSAPACMASSTSSGPEQLAIRATWAPSFVRQGPAAPRAASRFFRMEAPTMRRWASLRTASSGSRMRRPLSASSTAPAAQFWLKKPAPSCTTAGMPMVRAMMEAWLCSLPSAQATPSSMPRPMETMSLG